MTAPADAVARGHAASMRDAVYNLTAGGLRVAAALLAIPLLLRALGATGYGLWALASAAMGVVMMAEGPLSTATTVFSSRELDDARALSRSLTALIVLAGAMAALCVLAGASPAPTLLSRQMVPDDPDAWEPLARALRVASLVAAARLAYAVLTGILQAERRFGVLNAIVTAQTLATTAAMVAIAWMGGDAAGLMKAQLAGSLIGLIALIAAVLPIARARGVRLEPSASKIREVARYMSLSWTASLGTALFTYLDRLVVGALLGARAGGIYAATVGIGSQINVLSALAAQPVMAMVAKAWSGGAEERAEGRERVGFSFEVSTAIAFSLGLVCMAFAHPIASILFAPVTPEAVWGVRSAALIYALYSPNAVGYYVLFSLHALKRSAAITFAVGCSSLLLVAAGASRLGLVGAVLGNAGYLGVWLLTVVAMRLLGVPARAWWGWLWPYLLWFVAASAVAPWLPPGWLAPVLFAAFAHVIWLSIFYLRRRAVVGAWLRRAFAS